MSDDRTKADKAWEARQEAARYRIFNAATNAAEATDEADDEKYFAVLDQAGNAAEAAAAEITGYKTYADLLEGITRAATVLEHGAHGEPPQAAGPAAAALRLSQIENHAHPKRTFGERGHCPKGRVVNGPPRPGRRLRLIARKLPGAMNVNTAATDGIDSLVAAFDLTYEKFVAAGVLMKTRRSSYEGRVRRIATLMPIDEPWVFPQAKSTA